MLLRRDVMNDPSITVKKLKEMQRGVLGGAAVRTVQERLQKDFKLPCRRAAHKPPLTDKMRNERLDSCRKYEHWTLLNWRKVVFSGKHAFKTVDANRSNGSKFEVGAGVAWGCFTGEKEEVASTF